MASLSKLVAVITVYICVYVYYNQMTFGRQQNIGLPRFTALHFIVLYRCCVFYKIKPRPSISKKDTTYSIQCSLYCGGLDRTRNISEERFYSNPARRSRLKFRASFISVMIARKKVLNTENSGSPKRK